MGLWGGGECRGLYRTVVCRVLWVILRGCGGGLYGVVWDERAVLDCGGFGGLYGTIWTMGDCRGMCGTVGDFGVMGNCRGLWGTVGGFSL